MAQYGVSFVAYVYAYDSAAGTYKTGDSANIALRWTKDGTNSATTNACSEVDATNSPGLYKVTLTATEATCTVGQLSGKSSTATTIVIMGQTYAFDSYTTVLPVGGIAGLGVVDGGTLQSATGTTAVIRSAASFADSRLIGMTLLITGGTGVGQARVITAYTQASVTCTVDTWTTTPDSTSTYLIYGSAAASSSLPVPADVKKINAVSTSSVTTVSAYQGTTQPVNFTGTGASALAKGDMVDIAGTASAGTAGYVGVDWAHVAAPTTSVNLSGTTIATSQVVASVSGAVGSVTGAVGSVTGNVGGNVTGSVGSVTARVTANADQLAGQTVTAAAGVTFPTSVASPTNITAGTITTVTNLTNAATAGDFTATMKTSLNAATPASVVGAVGSVTGNVGGNVVGSVGSLTTNNDKTGYALSATGSAAMTESYAADGAAATLPQLLYLVVALLSEFAISGTTLTAKKLDGSTTAATFTLNDATNPTSITRAS